MSDQEVGYFFHSVPGQEITWAGICPWTERLCFGLESGHLYFLPDFEGQQPPPVKAYGFVTEPVNSVAFSGDLVGVTSRSEVALAWRGPGDEPEKAERFSGGCTVFWPCPREVSLHHWERTDFCSSRKKKGRSQQTWESSTTSDRIFTRLPCLAKWAARA